MIFWLESLFSICAIIFIFKFHSNQPLLEKLVKLVCSLFFIYYIGYRLELQWNNFNLYPHRFTFFVWVNWGLVMLLFIFFLLSYLIRLAPKEKANKPKEFIIPVFCAFLPFVIVESPQWIFYEWVQNYSLAKILIKPFYVQTPTEWNYVSILFISVGGTITVLAMLALKRSFSIFTEVRDPVFSGIYRYIRHPMYIGEILSTIGLVCLAPNWLGIMMTLLFVVLLFFRAKNEEDKIKKVFKEYDEYSTKVGYFFKKN